MKRFKKKVVIVFALVLVALTSTRVLAAETDNKIPERMQPNTVIQYGSHGSYTILEGGELPKGAVNENGLTFSEQKIADRNYKNAITLAGGESNIIKVENPKPHSELKVIMMERDLLRIMKI